MKDGSPTISDPELRALQILQVALTVAPVVFLAVVALLPLEPPAEVAPEAVQQMGVFSAAHAFAGLGMVAASFVVPARILASQGVDAGSLRQALLLRLALLEGVALFGAAILFLAKGNGALEVQPALWANAASVGLLLLISAGTFPSRAVVDRMLEEAA